MASAIVFRKRAVSAARFLGDRFAQSKPQRSFHVNCCLLFRGGSQNDDDNNLNSKNSNGHTSAPPRLVHNPQHPMVIPNTLSTARRRALSTSQKNDNQNDPSHDNGNLLSFDTTPLGSNGRHLLKGLKVYQVQSSTDGHPLSVYGLDPQHHGHDIDMDKTRKPILLLHGRTWSSVPVYHLLGGQDDKTDNGSMSSRSLMEALWHEGLQPYCMDFRGFGGTHRDVTGCVEPLQCVSDAQDVLRWIRREHHPQVSNHDVTLLGWSQGALVAQLAAQLQPPNVALEQEGDSPTLPPGDSARNDHKHDNNLTDGGSATRLFGKLVLYGSIYDPLVRYPREPLYRFSQNKTNDNDNNHNDHPKDYIENTFDMALEDFTIQGTMAPEPAQKFAHAALLSDPIKAVWRHLYQFNNCDPARVTFVKTLVVAGDQDPYAPLRVQQDLFCHLGRGCDRTWAILSDCDHAVHLLEPKRERLIHLVARFVQDA